MQDGDPQIHLAGNEPDAGRLVVKSMRVGAATARV
jgi:hypothetical protein